MYTFGQVFEPGVKSKHLVHCALKERRGVASAHRHPRAFAHTGQRGAKNSFAFRVQAHQSHLVKDRRNSVGYQGAPANGGIITDQAAAKTVIISQDCHETLILSNTQRSMKADGSAGIAPDTLSCSRPDARQGINPSLYLPFSNRKEPRCTFTLMALTPVTARLKP